MITGIPNADNLKVKASREVSGNGKEAYSKLRIP